jgi:hypothetical protein
MPKSGNRFSEKVTRKTNLERDDAALALLGTGLSLALSASHPHLLRRGLP